ncbi:hypothetical protein WICMUC_002833 [Wickerhamomyces mucosus]|uniref:Uncharacterized protein n=1 Tax=Wickerhamomyces mucosus TaxID=1378264 RepID=A0A9P8PPC6_9ASCO|nr:hypothetical protein WICMUC_002833 [Wickerhamomyces mucosus]
MYISVKLTPTSSQEIQASEMLQIENHASTIIRLVEELLSITRTLKESWILGQLPVQTEYKDPTIGIEFKINEALDKILQSKRLEDEVNEKDFDSEIEELKEGEAIEINPIVDENSKKEFQIEPVSVDKKNQPGPRERDQQHETKPEVPQVPELQDINPNSQFDEAMDNDFGAAIDLRDNDNLNEIDFESFGNIDNNHGDDDIIMLD